MKNRLILSFLNPTSPSGDLAGNTTPVFRPYLQSESGQIKDLVLRVLGEQGFSYDPILNYDLDHLEEIYGQGHGRIFVVVSRSEVIGTHGLVDNLDGTIYCRRLTLDRAYRGNGWLYPQLAFARDYCRRLGFRSMKFDTLEKSGMIPSYEKFGYRIIKHCLEGSNIKVTMELVLN